MTSIQKMALFAVLMGIVPCREAVAQQPVPWNKNRIRIEIPISWEITGSDFVEGGIATQSESYHEIWSFQFDKGFKWTIASPRAKVHVTPVGWQEGYGLPMMFVVDADRFATLLGVTDFDYQNWKERTEKGIHDLVFVTLGLGVNATQEIPLYITKTDYYSVILMLWR